MTPSDILITRLRTLRPDVHDPSKVRQAMLDAADRIIGLQELLQKAATLHGELTEPATAPPTPERPATPSTRRAR